MKTKIKIKFNLDETIRRLNEISKGFNESAERMGKIIVKMEEIETLKNESLQVVEDQRKINWRNPLQSLINLLNYNYNKIRKERK